MIKFTTKRFSPIIQELFSWFLLSEKLKGLKLNEFDIHFNYNTIVSGYYIGKRLRKFGINSVYDLADNLPEMIATSPQINNIFRDFAKYFARYLVKKNIQLAKKITYITPSLKKNLSIPDDKSVLLPNGVNVYSFTFSESNLYLKKYGLQNSFVIGFIGALREWVNFQPVFEAIKELKPLYPNVKVLIIGEEEGLTKVKNQADILLVTDMIIFHHAIPYNEVPQNINCMDVCLIPFEKNIVGHDSLPLKLFEYMACQKPVVTSDIVGIHETVTDKVLYADTKEQYKQQISRLYCDSTLRKDLGERSRKFVEEKFSLDTLMIKLEHILEASK